MSAVARLIATNHWKANREAIDAVRKILPYLTAMPAVDGFRSAFNNATNFDAGSGRFE